MGKKIDLSDKEKFSIKILKSLSISINKIAMSINRHRSTISRYLKCGDTNKRQNCGRKRILNNRSLRRISRVVNNKPVSASYLISTLGLKCTSQTLRNSMRNNNILWRKCKPMIYLSTGNKTKRLEYCRTTLCRNIQWNNVIFSDEKRFCLDGIENLMYGWSNNNKRHVIMKRHSGGGGIMVWAAISPSSKSELVIIEGRLNSQRYVEMLESNLLPMMGPEQQYQQDNAPIHVSALTKKWFISKNIPLLPWPARSPDLNIIENVWAHMCKDVYMNGKQYSSINELKIAVLRSWDKIDFDYINTLYSSINKRLLDVIDVKGALIKY